MKYFRYHNTNCFFIECCADKLLAFDAGWPCTLYEYRRCMKAIGLNFESIKIAVVSHMHMDHAGLLGEFIKANIECFILDEQMGKIDEMEGIILKNHEYRDYARIEKAKLSCVSLAQLNETLVKENVQGEMIRTIGHSDDSISFVSDIGEALIGDLSPINQIMSDDAKTIASWKALKDKGAKIVFPSHADVFRL